MSQAFIARVTCPNCQNQFQTPVEQVLDVRSDPGAKMRVLNGLVNVAACPHCGTTGALNLPFLYHDPENELALIYMPMEAGRDNIERQQAIGRFTSSVMESLPPEERKAYLLQPQEFFTLENLIGKILEVDGVTSEMIEEQKAKAELLQRMIDAPSDEALEAIIEENKDIIDENLIQLLMMNMDIARSGGALPADIQRLETLRDKLFEMSDVGKQVKTRIDLLNTLRAEPSRENLLELLIEAPDEETREVLITFGRPLLDYLFFQSLTSLIEGTSDEEEQEQLKALRSEILDVRDQVDQQVREMYQERVELLRDLLISDDPEKLARYRFQEIDPTFFEVLGGALDDAKAQGNREAVENLQHIWDLIMELVEERLPPAMQLFNRILVVEDEAEVDELLRENRDLVTEDLLEFMEAAENKMRSDGRAESADRLALALTKARTIIS